MSLIILLKEEVIFNLLLNLIDKLRFFRSNFDSVAKHLTYSFVILGLISTLLITAIQIYRDHHREFELLNSQIIDLEATHTLSLSASLWQFAEKQIELELKGILNNSNFEYVEIVSSDGRSWSFGNFPLQNAIINEIPLIYAEQERSHNLGLLSIVANKKNIYQRIRKHALETLLYFAVLISIIAVTQFFIVQSLVTRHLSTLAKYTSNITFNETALSAPLTLERKVSPANQHDELSQVVNSINSMQNQLSSSIEELQKLSRAVESGSAAVYITDLEGIFEYINPKFTEITGYTKSDTEGQSPAILKSGNTPKKVYEELWQTIQTGIVWKGELYNRRKDGSNYWARTSISCIKNSKNEITHYVAIQDDVTNEYMLSEKLGYQASHDSLTDLLNRREFELQAIELLNSMTVNKDTHALCYLDLDQFKVVNDTCGHIAGDNLLQQLSLVLKKSIRQGDVLARLGGDEFGILIKSCSVEHAFYIAETIKKVIQNFQFTWEGYNFRVGVSIGLVPVTQYTPNLNELLKNADSACYMAKDLGRNRIHVYSDEDTEIINRAGEMEWVNKINHALEEDRFCLYAQLISPLDSSDTEHYEVLVRMIDVHGKVIPPGAFLPAAERYGLTEKLDFWVIDNTFTLLEKHVEFLNRIDFISINLSGPSLNSTDILSFVSKRLKSSNIPGEKVCFEITETAAISNLSRASDFISTLKTLNCRFALDDFGTGLSSFGYLKSLPVDYLKIDGIFIKNIVDNSIDHAMVKSINEIGQIMGIETIAEFVENEDIAEMLEVIGVNFAQGYGIAAPVPIEKLL